MQAAPPRELIIIRLEPLSPDQRMTVRTTRVHTPMKFWFTALSSPVESEYTGANVFGRPLDSAHP